MSIKRYEQRLSGSTCIVTEEIVSSGVTGDPILVEGGETTVTVHASGTAKVQYTTSRPKKVTAGNARWIDWARGEVVGSVSDIPEGPIVAVRVVSVAGDAVIEVVR